LYLNAFIPLFRGVMKKGKKLPFILLFSLPSFFASAQNGYYSITGKALQKNNKPVEAGNIIALHAKDSSIIKGDLFTEGLFRLDGLRESVLLLKITSLGFKPVFLPLRRTNSDSIINLGSHILTESKDLDEIEIVAKIPLFENDGEKIKVNVEGTNLGAGGTVLDVLRRSPGVLVNANDNVSIFGKGTPIIYLDGQLLASNEILKSLPAEAIKTIEIINNPSARYDAAGRAVINIITKRGSLQGYNATLIQNTAYGKYLGSYSGIRFNARKGKWSTDLGYSARSGYDWDSDLFDRKFNTNDTTVIDMHNYIFNRQQNKNSHFYNAGIDYQIDSVSNIRFSYNGFYNLVEELSDNTNAVSQNGSQISTLETSAINTPLYFNSSFNLSFLKKLDSLGSEFFTAAQYGNFLSSSTSLITQDIRSGISQQIQQKRNRNNSDIKIITAQTDLTKYFTKKWKLDAGFKESYVIKGGELQFDNFSAGEWVSDPSYYSGFDFRENILAAYSELRYKGKKFNMRFGGRAEHTHTDGYSRTLDSQVVSREYLNFFPSGFIGYDFTEEIKLGFTYSSRIHRPTYQDMDPFINYIDSLSSMRGNPFLLPEYTSSYELALTYDEEVTLLTVSYNRTSGAMNLVLDRLNDGSNAFTASTKNLDLNESFSLGTTLPYENKWITFATYFGYLWNTVTYKSSGTVITNAKPTFYTYLYTELRFKKLFSFEMEGEYTGNGVDGIFTFKPFYWLNAGIKKKFLKDKLTVRLIANDVLKSYRECGGSNIPGYDIQYLSRENTNHFALLLSYNFGKMTSSGQRNKNANVDEYNRIKMEK